MEQLQPGRNYSIAVKAVSNGIESLERRLFQATSKYINLQIEYSYILSCVIESGLSRQWH
jgi:hypothetical protein